MDSFRNLFADEIQKRGTVYNATEGGVGIPGARSLSLKEVINRIYTKPRRDFKKCLTEYYSTNLNANIPIQK